LGSSPIQRGGPTVERVRLGVASGYHACVIAITPTSVTLVAGQTQQLSPVVKNATGTTIVGAIPDGWLSANTAVAAVGATGLVTAVGAGGPINVTAPLTSAALTTGALADATR
jgi:uncharacterized protein YjdB